jgi:predicted NAD/FAD-dependent oxidoreductase
MAGFAARVAADFDGAFCSGPELAWAARDSSKPGRAPGERWVLHATPEWSEQALEHEPSAVAAQLLAAFARELGGALPPTTHVETHRWRFASPGRPVELAHPVDLERGLVLAGDWLAGGRIEGAYLSGLAAAEAVLTTTTGAAF